jgi:hypothetical protein
MLLMLQAHGQEHGSLGGPEGKGCHPPPLSRHPPPLSRHPAPAHGRSESGETELDRQRDSAETAGDRRDTGTAGDRRDTAGFTHHTAGVTWEAETRWGGSGAAANKAVPCEQALSEAGGGRARKREREGNRGDSARADSRDSSQGFRESRAHSSASSGSRRRRLYSRPSSSSIGVYCGASCGTRRCTASWRVPVSRSIKCKGS